MQALRSMAIIFLLFYFTSSLKTSAFEFASNRTFEL